MYVRQAMFPVTDPALLVERLTTVGIDLWCVLTADLFCRCMQTHGGYAFASDFGIERKFRESKL